MTERELPQGGEAWLEEDETEARVVEAEVSAAPGSLLLPLLIGAAGLVIAGVTLAGGLVFQIIGYLSASLLLFTAVAWFRRGSFERAAREGIATSSGLNAAALLLLIAGFALAVTHAWKIAVHFS